MKPLTVLLLVFTLSLLLNKAVRGSYEMALSGRIALSAMLLFTAVAHFVFTNGMTMILPGFVPYKTTVVYLTGLIEIAAAIGLFIPKVRVLTAWLLIAFFILILPSNIYAALKQVDYQQGTYDGHGTVYLWFRVPLQFLFIFWTYWFVIKN